MSFEINNGNQKKKSSLPSTTSSTSLLLNQTTLAWAKEPNNFFLASPVSLPQATEEISFSLNQQHQETNVQLPSNDTSSSLHQQMESLNLSAEQQQQIKESPSTEVIANNSTKEAQLNIFHSQVRRLSVTNIPYQEVDHHWFYLKDAEQSLWQPFSLADSYNLEFAFRQGWLDTMVATNGSRFDVCLRDRTRRPVYWQGSVTRVQRCSWFYKRDSDYQFVPYSEEISEILESSYKHSVENNAWNTRVALSQTEFAYFYSHNSVYHYFSELATSDGWSSVMSDSSTQRPRYVYRGPWNIQMSPDRDESSTIDHLVFVIHGIGDFCDISFRGIVDVVEDFRSITHELLSSHYGQSVGRVEVLPITWHQALHTANLDRHLHMITLPSIPRLRAFTNDTILDALFYTSPLHSMTILNSVANELNRLYQLFCTRNSSFQGTVALMGHSLGSLILFDLLSYQQPHQTDHLSNTYQVIQINFQPKCLFALGSPLSVFLTTRGIQKLELNFKLPTCSSFYNVFHPYDPIAYRLEPMINSEFARLKPVLIPHHKGRKRIHLELKDSITRVGSDLKQKFMSSLRGALNSFYGFARGHYDSDESPQVDSVSNRPEELTQLNSNETMSESLNNIEATSNQSEQEPRSALLSPSPSIFSSLAEMVTGTEDPEISRIESLDFGRLNQGRRIDYVLQEKPFEIVNEYLFAITSHGCYWFSEDTSLLMLRELYSDHTPLTQQPQQSSPY